MTRVCSHDGPLSAVSRMAQPQQRMRKLGDGTPIFKNHRASLRRLDTRTYEGSNNVLMRYAVPDDGFKPVQR